MIGMTGMSGQRPAAALIPGNHDFDAIGAKHSQRRMVDVRRQHLLDAAAQ
jgi:hypothetical protein